VLGLPDDITACLFDMDGVLTKTAAVHAAAWKQAFDEFLEKRAKADGTPFVPFDLHDDYDEYVDGKPREDGVRDFLASRKITLPEGTPDDPPTADTVYGVGNRKNELLLQKIKQDGVQVYDGSVRYLEACQQAGLRRAVVSSSANTQQVLDVTGLAHFFEVRVDGVTVAQQHLHGKPAPDTYLDAARQLGVEPGHAAVFEDALSGVEAGHAGHFGYVVGVDRVGQAAALAQHGADRVVEDLGDLLDAGQPGQS
jgi:beta-phosphoglucomutase family hydrolase